MKEYRYPTLLNKSQWLEVLKDSEIITDIRKEILIEFGNSEEHRSAGSIVGKRLDSNAGAINLTMHHFSKAITRKLSIEPHFHKEENRHSYWSMFFYGYHEHPFFYWQLRDELVKAMIESNWIDGTTKVYYDELSIYIEGQKRISQTITYGRNTAARAKCIEYHKCHCAVCGFDFGKEFGSHGEGYICLLYTSPSPRDRG